MFCPKCGKENPDENKFCVYCGNALKLNITEEKTKKIIPKSDKFKGTEYQNDENWAYKKVTINAFSHKRFMKKLENKKKKMTDDGWEFVEFIKGFLESKEKPSSGKIVFRMNRQTFKKKVYKQLKILGIMVGIGVVLVLVSKTVFWSWLGWVSLIGGGIGLFIASSEITGPVPHIVFGVFLLFLIIYQGAIDYTPTPGETNISHSGNVEKAVKKAIKSAVMKVDFSWPSEKHCVIKAKMYYLAEVSTARDICYMIAHDATITAFKANQSLERVDVKIYDLNDSYTARSEATGREWYNFKFYW